jgi:hypothetical protein
MGYGSLWCNIHSNLLICKDSVNLDANHLEMHYWHKKMLTKKIKKTKTMVT